MGKGNEFEDPDLLGGKPVVVGISGARTPTSPILLALARGADSSLVLLIFLGALTLSRLPPFPGIPQLLLLLSAILIPFGARLLVGVTPGEALTRTRKNPKRPGYTSRPDLDGLHLASLAGAIVLLFLTTGWLAARALFLHPLFAPVEAKTLPAFIPPLQSPDFWVRAHFYSLGAWPARPFQQKVVYSLPYEAGPPILFPGRIVAQWLPLEISVTFEGPKTPDGLRDAAGKAVARDTLRECFLSGSLAWDCLRYRKALLSRPLDEIERGMRGVPHYRLEWLSVSNPQLPPIEWPEGLRITATLNGKTQIRFVAVTWGGTEQAFFLTHQGGEKGLLAERLFEQSLQSLKLTDDLDTLRAWSERDLLEIHMKELEQLDWKSDEFFDRVTTIQSVLLSRISVQPKDYDAYFHLGGTSSLLIRHALAASHPEIAAAAQKTLFSAWKYAHDVKPQDPRGFQLERLWDELKEK